MLWKCCTECARKFGILSSGQRTEKCQFLFQSQRKAMPKNARTTTQLHSSHVLEKWCSKFPKPGFNSTWTVNFQMFKMDLEKAEKRESDVSQSCLTLCDPMDSSLHQAPPSMGFSRQEYWSELPFPSPGNLPYPGIKPRSPVLWADAFRLTSNPTLSLRYCTALHTLSLTSLHLLWFHYYTEFALANVINYLKLLKPVVSTFVLNLLAFGTEAYFLLPEIPFSCP